MNISKHPAYYKDKLQAVEAVVAESLIINDIFLVLYMVVGVSANVLVVYVYVLKMKRRDKDNRFLIPYLAVADCLACMVGSGFALILNIFPLSFNGEIRCKALWYLSTITTIFASFLLVLIATQRYVKVCHAHRLPVTHVWQNIALWITLVISGIMSIPVLLFYGEMKFQVSLDNVNVSGITCGKHAEEHDHQALLLYSIFLVATAVAAISTVTLLYALIGRKIYAEIMQHKTIRQMNVEPDACSKTYANDLIAIDKNSAVKTSERNSSVGSESQYSTVTLETPRHHAMPSPQLRQDKKEQKPRVKRINNKLSKKRQKVWHHFRVHNFTYMYMAITVVFVMSFSPRLVIIMLESTDVKYWQNLSLGELSLNLFFYRIYIVNHICNPFIYGFYDRTFRRMAIKLLKFWKH